MEKKTFDKFFDELNEIIEGKATEKKTPYDEVVERIHALVLKVYRKVSISVTTGSYANVAVHSKAFADGVMQFWFHNWDSEEEQNITFTELLEAVHTAIAYAEKEKEVSHV